MESAPRLNAVPSSQASLGRPGEAGPRANFWWVKNGGWKIIDDLLRSSWKKISYTNDKMMAVFNWYMMTENIYWQMVDDFFQEPGSKIIDNDSSLGIHG